MEWINAMYFLVGAFLGVFCTAIVSVTRLEKDEMCHAVIDLNALYIKKETDKWVAYVDGNRVTDTTGTIDELMDKLKGMGYMV